MNREIKFRGLTNSGKWVYGCLVYTENISPAIYYEIGEGSVKELHWVYVNKESIGEFTGLKDKNGKEVYEGDIIQDMDMYHAFEVFWENEHAQFAWSKNHIDDFSESCEDCEIIGNIKENPELLK